MEVVNDGSVMAISETNVCGRSERTWSWGLLILA